MRIAGRTAIVTGASSGIGRATAFELAEKGANVVLASRSREKLEAVADEIGGSSRQTLVIPTDVTDRFAVEALVRRSIEEYDAVDILVNNAGMGLYAPIAGGSLENMRRIFDVNFFGAVHCMQAVVPYMVSERRGHIVNVSSVAGKISPPYMGAYAATKHALVAASDALRSELSGTGVNVSTIYPGLTQSSFTEAMIQEVEVPHIPPIVRFIDASVVARRIAQAIRWQVRDMYVSPEDIAAVSINTIAPQLADLSMRLFMRPQDVPPLDIRLPQIDASADEPEAADAEPPSDTA
jgi:short-subunit dehydrogenase